jgi:ABC-2 type transport system permease protein
MRRGLRSVRLLLTKDLRVFGRSPGVVAALILYPLIVAVIVGLVVRYAGDRPRIALVDEDGLPAALEVGGQTFDVQQIFDRAAEDVELVRLTREEAERQLASGEVLGIVEIPEGFQRDLRGMVRQPDVKLRTTESAIATRVVEKVQSLVYLVNLRLQRAYIEANLKYVNLLKDGGSGSFLGDDFDVMGLAEAGRRLDQLAQNPDPDVRSEAEELANFVRQARLALESTDESLRATANPIQLEREESGGRALILSADVQAYALALTLGFIGLIVAAAGIAGERDENVFGRLTRGLVRLWELVGEKIAFVAVVGGAIGLLLAVVFGLVVELGNAAGGEPWGRLPLVVIGLVLGAAAFGALGVLIGSLAREARAATLVAFLVALPIVLLGLVPSSVVPAAGGISQALPFAHTVNLLSAALADADPGITVLREIGWLLGLGAAFAVLARVAVRRLGE